MLTKEQHQEVIARSLGYFEKAGIVLTDSEKREIETADFGLNDIESTGLEVLMYVNTDRYCAQGLRA